MKNVVDCSQREYDRKVCVQTRRVYLPFWVVDEAPATVELAPVAGAAADEVFVGAGDEDEVVDGDSLD